MIVIDSMNVLIPFAKKSSLAPNKGSNNWCHSRLRDFDFETFRDYFRLRDQKTSGAMAPVAPLSLEPLSILKSTFMLSGISDNIKQTLI